MRRLISLAIPLFICSHFSGCAAAAAVPVTLTIRTGIPAMQIPQGFSGLSFETGSLHYNNHNYKRHAYFFDPTNTGLLTLFRNLGIKTIRLGGNSVDRGYVPSFRAINTFFRFVKAAHVKVIYSLRLANGSARQDAMIARYIWSRYRRYLVCLAIGNEPNSYNDLDPEITDVSSYITKWKRFSKAVTRAAPGVKIGGPDSGNGATKWASAFARAERGSVSVRDILCHYEPGGTSRRKSARQFISLMLSPAWDVRNYFTCYRRIGAMALSHGFAYRFTECNSFVATPFTHGDNHSFATALWALDFMHWWAEHQCRGVNFHTGLIGFNSAIYVDRLNGYAVYPEGYGVAAFHLGGCGRADPLTIDNPEHLDLTAYAVTARDGTLCMTVINKSSGRDAHQAAVRIEASGTNASVVYLSAPDNNAAATSGITLGGSAVNGDGPWLGRWKPLKPRGTAGCVLVVPATSAAIVKLAKAKIGPDSGRKIDFQNK